MLFSKPTQFLFLFASLLSANAETIRGVQQERELTSVVNPVDLGLAGNYAVLAKTGISTVPSSVITGDIAVSPIASSAITGFTLILDPDGGRSATSTQVVGNAYAASYLGDTPSVLTTAVGNMQTAYTDAAGRDNTMEENLGGGEIGGLTLEAGVYTFIVDINISKALTLTGSDTDIFIIRTTKNLMLAANQRVTLAGGALAKNIFWQVAGKVDVMAGAHMEGVILAKTGVTFTTLSSLNGRILTQTAAVLQQATIMSNIN